MTGVRILAALLVIAFHYSTWYLVGAPSAIRNVAASGFVGVGLFFVLSGFVLAYTYLRADGSGSIDRGAFWGARLARIYPLYAFSLILSLPILLFVLHERQGVVGASATALAELVPTLAMVQAWTPWSAEFVNYPAWSLSAEAFFYAVFPFLAIRLARQSNRRLLLIAPLLWLLPLSVATAYRIVRPDGPHVDFLHPSAFWLVGTMDTPLLRLPEFGVGVIAGVLFLRHGTRFGRRAGALLSCTSAALLAGLLAFSSSIPPPYVHDGALTPVFACLIFGLALGGGPLAWLLERPALILLGEASYGVYLLQAPVFNLLSKALQSPMHTRVPYASPIFFAVYVPLLVGFSILCLQVIEKPCRKAIRAWLARPRLQMAVAAAPKAGEPVPGHGGTVARNVMVLLAGQPVTWVLSTAFLFVVPRSIGPSGWGEWTLATSAVAVAGIVLDVGMTNLVIKEVGRARTAAAPIVGVALAARLLLGVVLVAVLAGFTIAAHYPRHTQLVIAVVAVGGLASFVAVPALSALQGLEKMHYYTIAKVVSGGLFSVLCVIGVKVFSIGILSVAALFSLGPVIMAGVEMVWLRRHMPVWPRFDWAQMRALLVRGIPYWSLALAVTFYINFDGIMLSRMAPIAVVGWYGGAVKVMGVLFLLPFVVSTALLPALSQTYHLDRDQMSRLGERGLVLITTLGLPATAGCAILAPAIVIWLYGPTFVAAGPVLRILAFSLLPAFVATVVSTFLLAADQQARWSWVMGACVIANVVINFFAIRYFQSAFGNGAMGAAVSQVITDVMTGVGAILVLPREMRGWIFKGLPTLGRAAAATAAMALVVLLFRSRFVLLPVGAGVGTFAVAALLLQVFPADEVAMVRARVGRLGRRFGFSPGWVEVAAPTGE